MPMTYRPPIHHLATAFRQCTFHGLYLMSDNALFDKSRSFPESMDKNGSGILPGVVILGAATCKVI